MNSLSIAFLAMLSCSQLPGQDVAAPSESLKAIKEQGRAKSRFLNESVVEEASIGSIPRANVDYFRQSLQSVLNKSCLACHGPERIEGNVRVAALNPDLLTGLDVAKWRQIYHVVSNSEMPPADEPLIPYLIDLL